MLTTDRGLGEPESVPSLAVRANVLYGRAFHACLELLGAKSQLRATALVESLQAAT